MALELDTKLTRFQPVGIGGTRKLSRRETAKRKIFVGTLPPEFFSMELFNLFAPFGVIREAVVLSDRFRTRSRCYGFVTFVEEESAQKALKAKLMVDEKELLVKLASVGAKRRRAEFFVNHGSSTGHPQLKFVKGSGKKLIHCDPSLYRTANIQHIPAAQLSIKKRSAGRRKRCQFFPNEDIENDYIQIKRGKAKTPKPKKTRGTTPDAVHAYFAGFPRTRETNKLTGNVYGTSPLNPYTVPASNQAPAFSGISPITTGGKLPTSLIPQSRSLSPFYYSTGQTMPQSAWQPRTDLSYIPQRGNFKMGTFYPVPVMNKHGAPLSRSALSFSPPFFHGNPPSQPVSMGSLNLGSMRDYFLPTPLPISNIQTLSPSMNTFGAH